MPINILELAGGWRAVAEAAFDLDHTREAHAAAPAIVATATQRAEDALSAQLFNQLGVEREMFELMNGERPRAPSDEAEQWDEDFEAEILPKIESFAAHAGVPQKWIIAHVSGGVRPAELDARCREVAQAMITQAVSLKDSMNKKLSAIGIIPGDVEPMWSTLRAAKVPAKAVEAEPRYDFLGEYDLDGGNQASQSYKPEDVTAKASVSAPGVEGTPRSAIKKRGRKHGTCYVLPSTIFQTLRRIGVSDKEGAAATGIAKSSWNRVASGEATELGLTQDDATNLLSFVGEIMKRLDSVVDHLSEHGLELKAS